MTRILLSLILILSPVVQWKAEAQSIPGPGVLTSVYTINAGSCGTVTRYTANDSTGTSANVSSVTLGAADQVLVFASEASGGTSGGHIISVTSGATAEPGVILPIWTYDTAGSSFAFGTFSAFYISSAVAISNATLTVTFNASATSPRISVIDVPNATGTAALDSLSSFNNSDNTETSLNQVPITISGYKDCIIEAQGYTTAVASPWNTNFAAIGGTSQGQHATSWLSNQTSSPATPTWTSVGTGMGGTLAVALGYGTSASVSWALQDYSGGTNGSVVTLAGLDAGLFGAANKNSTSGGTLATAYQSSNIGSSGLLTATNTPVFPLINTAPRFNINGGVYPNTGQLSLQYAQGGGACSADCPGASLVVNGGISNGAFLSDPVVSQSVDFELTNQTTDAIDSNMDIFVTGSVTSCFVTMRFNNTGSANQYNPEGGCGSTSNFFNGAANTHYKMSAYDPVGNMASQTPGVALTGGTPVTVTLSPGPWAGTYTSYPVSQLSTLGLNGISPYYIANGTGTAEYVTPSSTTCTTIAPSSCTITFTPSNSHSGSWTIVPAAVVWIMNSTATSILSTNYYAQTSVSSLNNMCVGNCGGAGSGTSGRYSYWGNQAMCWSAYYLTGSPCPAIIVP